MSHGRLVASGVVLLLVGGPAGADPSGGGHGSVGKGPDAMAAARAELRREHGGQSFGMVFGERLEYRFDDAGDVLLWDVDGWYGSDLHRLWIKTEGDYVSDAGELDEGELQALYSRAMTPYFDLQMGVRHDFEPRHTRSHAVVGLHGLAPYWFELDAALFVSQDGDVSARLEATYDILITQRLVAQPRTELELAAHGVPELGFGSGLSSVELDLRLRYELRREVAPYLGVSWEWLVGDSADLARAAGEATRSISAVVGLRFWY